MLVRPGRAPPTVGLTRPRRFPSMAVMRWSTPSAGVHGSLEVLCLFVRVARRRRSNWRNALTCRIGRVFLTGEGSVYGHARRLRRAGKNTGFVIP